MGFGSISIIFMSHFYERLRIICKLRIFLKFIFFNICNRSKSSSRSSTPPPSFAECQQRPDGEHEEGSEMFEEPVEEMVSSAF